MPPRTNALTPGRRFEQRQAILRSLNLEPPPRLTLDAIVTGLYCVLAEARDVEVALDVYAQLLGLPAVGIDELDDARADLERAKGRLGAASGALLRKLDELVEVALAAKEADDAL